MNTRSFFISLLMILVLVGGVAWQQGDVSPAGVSSDIAMHGTAWQPQRLASFKLWQPSGWGTDTRSTVAGGLRWVHMAIPYLTYLNDVGQKLWQVEFCAKSSNGAGSKPIRYDIWGGASVIASSSIAWPADNAVHCITHHFTPTWYQDVSLSVQLRYANTTDIITLLKAWIRVGP